MLRVLRAGCILSESLPIAIGINGLKDFTDFLSGMSCLAAALRLCARYFLSESRIVPDYRISRILCQDHDFFPRRCVVARDTFYLIHS